MTRKSFTEPILAHHHWREVFRTRGLCVGPEPQALGNPAGHKRVQGRVPDSRMKVDGAGDRCPDPPLGGSRRAWGSRRCRLAGRVRDFTVPFAQTIGALAPRSRRTGARDSHAGCQRIRECRDTGAGREGARSHREVGGQAARQQATGLRRRGTGRGRSSRHAGASHHFKRALRGGMTRGDSNRRCTTPGCLRGEVGGRAPHRPRRGTPRAVRRRSHEAQASDWHQNGILWIAHDVPKKEPLHLGSSGVTTKSGQLSATGGLYGNNESARICPRSRLGKGASR